VARGDIRSALAQAEYLIDELEAPGAFSVNADDLDGPSLSDGSPSAFWIGSDGALARMGVKAGEALQKEIVALAFQGLSADGEQLRPASHGRVSRPSLHFSLPKDVALLHAAADGDPQLQAKIEHIALRAAHQAVCYLLGTKGVIFDGRDEDGNAIYVPTESFIGLMSLHSTARIAEGEIVPSPLLGVHVELIAGEHADGSLRAIDTEALFCNSAPIEGGAIFRSLAAQDLVQLGFGVRPGTGKKNRFFEIDGISQAYRDANSGRTKQVERERAELEALLNREVSNYEASDLALKDRKRKDPRLPRSFIRAAWRKIAKEHDGLDLAGVHRLQRPRTLAPLEERLAWARIVAHERIRERGPTVPLAEANAILVEASGGMLSVRECNRLLREMQLDGEVLLLEDGRVTTPEIREQEQLVMDRVLGAARRGGRAVSRQALNTGYAETSRAFGFEFSADGDQRAAVELLCSGAGIGVLHGRGGTGKGPVLRAVVESLRADGRRVIAAAPDSQTQGVMNDQLACEAHTLAGLFGMVNRGEVTLDDNTVLIIDEASKISGDDWKQITEWLEVHKIELIISGHTGQHEAIELPGIFDEIVRQREPETATSDVLVKVAEITEIRRHAEQWQKDLQIQVDTGAGEAAVETLRENEAIAVSDSPEEAVARTVELWDAARRNYKDDPMAAIMVVSGSNDDVDRLNLLAQEARRQNDELGTSSVEAVDRDYRIYPGDLVVLSGAPYSFPRRGRGAPKQERIANHTIGVVRGVDPERDVLRIALREPGMPEREVEIDQGELRERLKSKKAKDRVPAWRLAYAHHTFPIQGSTVEEVFYCVVTMPSKNGFYVGITRERKKLHVQMHCMIGGEKVTREEVFAALAERISRIEKPQISLRYKQVSGWIAARLPNVIAYPLEERKIALRRDAARVNSELSGGEESAILGRLATAFGAERARRFSQAAVGLADRSASLDHEALQHEIDQGLAALAGLDVDGARYWTRISQRQQSIMRQVEQTERRAAEFRAEARHHAERAKTGRHSEREHHQLRQSQLLDAAATHSESATQHRERLAQLDYAQRKLLRGGRDPESWLLQSADVIERAIAAQNERRHRIDEACAAVQVEPAVPEIQVPDVAR
jgi:hypothetical protein